jgi:hypothetical protein
MPYILALLAILAGAAFWFYRLRDAGRAAGEIVDAAQTVKGAYNRRKFRNKVEGSAITAIDDAVTAATTIMMSLALARGPLSLEMEQSIREKLVSVMGVSNPSDIMTYARWAAEQSPDPNNIIVKLASLFNSQLSISERQDVIRMAEEICAAGGASDAIQQDALRRLRDRVATV